MATLAEHREMPQLKDFFLQYMGSKRRLCRQIAEIFPPQALVKRYIEPFCGSCAVFFAYAHPNSYLYDINPYLINFLNCIAEDRENIELQAFFIFQELLGKSENERKEYRNKLNDILDNADKDKLDAFRAAVFYVLQSCQIRGINYKKNGKIKKQGICKPENKHHALRFKPIKTVYAEKLQNAREIKIADYRQILTTARAGDLVYTDPPYMKTEEHDPGLNRGYMQNIDIKEFIASIRQAHEKGAFLAISGNAGNMDTIRQEFNGAFYIVDFRTVFGGNRRGFDTDYLAVNFEPYGQQRLFIGN